MTRTELEWDPVIFYCHHQTAPFPTRIFIPPFIEPISSNIHPLMARWLNVLGTNMAAYLDENDMPGAIQRVGFDNWYPGFLDFTHIFRNSISFFTETALYRYATPHFYSVDDFPKDRQELRSEVFYSSPWKGGWWRLARCGPIHAGRFDVRAGYGGEVSRAAAVQPLSGGSRQHGAVPQGASLRVCDLAQSSGTCPPPRF